MARREDLEHMRAALLGAMDVVDPQMLPQVVGQLRIVVKELSELPAATGESPLEQAKAKRAKRRAHLKAV
jgi:hypothetical protein